MDESNTNPLLVDVVVDNLFEYLDFDSLDECRNVCRLWRKVSKKHWSKLCPIRQIWENKGTTNIIDVIGGTRGVDSWSAKRLNKFKLTRFTFANNWMLEHMIWETHGKLITVLEIMNCEFTSATAFHDLLFCKATPVLETLTLIHNEFTFSQNQQEHRGLVKDAVAIIVNKPVNSLRKLDITFSSLYKNLPLEWEFVLQCFTQLQSLSLSNYDTGLPPPTTTSCELTRVLNAFESFYKKNGRAHPLTYLNISEAPGYWSSHPSLQFPTCILRFAQEGKINAVFRPTSFALNVAFPADQDRCYELLAHQQRDLTRLKIRSKIVRGVEIAGEDLKLPLLQHLTRLDLTEYRPLSFNFLLGCPNLKHLNICIKSRKRSKTKTLVNPIRARGVAPVEKTSQQQQLLLLPSMQSFHCNLTTDWNEEDMLVLGKSLPNLRSLLLFANKSSFRGICKAFPQLRRLFLCDSNLSDTSLTGFNSCPPNKGPWVAVSYPRLPNITDLKHLQVFGLHGRADGAGYVLASYSSGWKLTHDFFTYGLLEIPSLNKIHISNLSIGASGFLAMKRAGIEMEYSSDLFSVAMNPF